MINCIHCSARSFSNCFLRRFSTARSGLKTLFAFFAMITKILPIWRPDSRIVWTRVSAFWSKIGKSIKFPVILVGCQIFKCWNIHLLLSSSLLLVQQEMNITLEEVFAHSFASYPIHLNWKTGIVFKIAYAPFYDSRLLTCSFFFLSLFEL